MADPKPNFTISKNLEKETLEKKIKDIQFIFNSNPDFEKEVYETVGFKEKNPELKLNDPDTWYHATWDISNYLDGNILKGKKEDLSKFIYSGNPHYRDSLPPTDTRHSTNTNSPYFQKGGIWRDDYENAPFIITTENDKYFLPNKLGYNHKDFSGVDGSQGSGVLKPEFRDLKLFKIWKKYDKGKYVLLSQTPEQIYGIYLDTILLPEQHIIGSEEDVEQFKNWYKKYREI